MRWLIPSFLGDIELRRASDRRTELWIDGLTAQEADVLRQLRDAHSQDRLLGIRPKWAEREVWDLLGIGGDVGASYRDPGRRHIVLDAPMHQVEQALSKALKPNRSLLRAITYRVRMEQKIEAIPALPPAPSPAKDTTEVVTAERIPPAPAPPPKPKVDALAPPKAAVATTVAAPIRGCPMPAFCKADVRATRLLTAFLSPEQLREFNATQSFHVEGIDTGHLYLLTSRHAGHRWRRRGTLWDRDQSSSLCIHDWDVPASEELLSILVHLRVPTMERMMLALPEAGEPQQRVVMPYRAGRQRRRP